jgi:hypothetical protein
MPIDDSSSDTVGEVENEGHSVQHFEGLGEGVKIK